MKSFSYGLSFCLLLFLLPLVGSAEDSYPRTSIQSEQLHVEIYLPDADKGYYRGSRFDWSGLVQQVKYRDHVYFGDWKTTHNPTNFEDANGLASEFGMFSPIGYNDAKPKEAFVKIGIGELVKPKDEEYRFSKNYKVEKPFSWEIKQDKTWIEFHQIIPNWHDWGYDYVKRIELDSTKPFMKVTHTLKNIGKKNMNTDYYCHNFTMIDNEPISELYCLEFPFAIKTKQNLDGDIKLEKNKLFFLKKVTKALFSELEGWNPVAGHNGVSIINKKSGAGLRIKGTEAPYKYNFFTAPLATCLEPFIKLEIAPGATAKWTDEYTFFEEASSMQK